ncbi:DUF6209 family protein [Comamonas sp. JC664]|uniref:DUF6209 family protein n=1 Tax=Comamonas sp. JC664 TaxID=2801917 RepID=UPI001748AD81|nr:hypothetical protein [Comamonas sp. JC664]GHG81339.1 hypothetical protein GCM10012319_34480 [Comamonas sp. KCTC 72670]
MVRQLLSSLLPLVLVASTAAAQTTPVSIDFDGNWNETPSVDVIPMGGAVVVNYDVSRLPQCRSTNSSGQPTWTITGHVQVNQGPVVSFWVAGHEPNNQPTQRTLHLPATSTGALVLWFDISSPGCKAWDSNHGSNYHFPIGAPTLSFTSNWSELVAGTLRAGEPFIINYDASRLPECRATYNGPAWAIVAQYRFDNGPIQETAVTHAGYSVPTTLTAPAGARNLELWFLNADRSSCMRYDSNYGANYHFTLE